MAIVKGLIDFILNIDKHLNTIIQSYGIWTYSILFAIVFMETGLVFIPLLPGDSLIFAAGAFAGIGSLNIFAVYAILALAAILGDTVNYHIGKYLGPKIFSGKSVRFLKKEYLDETNAFYEKHGGKTIIIARFMPIIRTFAPFVAGIGNMNYLRFLSYNAIGGLMWVALFSFGGFFFGNLEYVRKNFTMVIFAIIFISILPGIISFIKVKFRKVEEPTLAVCKEDNNDNE